MADIDPQSLADIAYTNEMLENTHETLTGDMTRLLENVSAENSQPCVFSYLMQLHIFVETSFNEILYNGEQNWADTVEAFRQDHPEAFDVRFWAEQEEH